MFREAIKKSPSYARYEYKQLDMCTLYSGVQTAGHVYNGLQTAYHLHRVCSIVQLGQNSKSTNLGEIQMHKCQVFTVKGEKR